MDGHVHYLNRYYSVDENHVGKKVTLSEKDGQVQIYLRGKLIESHPKLSPLNKQSLCSTKPEHLSP